MFPSIMAQRPSADLPSGHECVVAASFMESFLAVLPRNLGQGGIEQFRPDPRALNDRRDGVFLTVESIEEVRGKLEEILQNSYHSDQQEDVLLSVRKRLAKMIKIMLILAVMDQGNLFVPIFAAGIFDFDLPLSRRQVEELIEDHILRAEFLGEQYRVCPRTLSANGHHEFEELEPLPLTSVRFLGRGGFGNVDEVVLASGKRYARKVWRCCNKIAAQQLRTEVKVLQKVSLHHHIVRLAFTYERGDEIGLLMSPVAACNLWEALNSPRRHRFLPDRALRHAFGCLISGLAYVHGHNIRHKDVKPHNILVENEKLLFTDFGLAFDYGSLSTSITHGQPAFRTVKYCAPEVADWDRRGRSSDVFSLGCVLSEVFSVLVGFGPEHPEGFSSLAPFHMNLAMARNWITNKLKSSHRTMHECDRIWLTVCRSMMSDRESRPPVGQLLQEISRVNNVESMSMLFCDTCRSEQAIATPTSELVRTVSLSDDVSAGHRKDQDVSISSSGSSYPSHWQTLPPPMISSVAMKTSRDLGFRTIDKLPPSLLIALENRFSRSQLDSWTRLDSGCLTLFAAGTWLCPSVLWCVLRHKSLLDFATCYAPATIRGIRRLAVENMTVPALVEGEESDEVHGMMILGIPKHHRLPNLEVSEHIIVPSRTIARTMLDDGSVVEKQVDWAMWLPGGGKLCPPEVVWSPSDVMESEWFKEQVADAQVEEDLLRDRSKGSEFHGLSHTSTGEK
jgi:serine/threonine protein kinase